MHRKVSGFKTLVSAVLTVATGVATFTVSAEGVAPITVEAARAGRSRIGAPITTATTKRVVSYADVSLTTEAGVKVIETRIRDAAKSACNELDLKYPVAAEGENANKCFNDAVSSAMADVQRRIDAAKLTANK